MRDCLAATATKWGAGRPGMLASAFEHASGGRDGD
jgi:hypothetical protein